MENLSNVYERLQAVRDTLRAEGVAKSGHNENDDFHYLELADFLPRGLELLKEQRLFSHVTYDKELASLSFIFLDDPEERIVFTAPMSTANARGLHPCQNQGWAQTYLRRRLYITAFEIVELDPVDATSGAAAEGKKKESPLNER